MSPRGFKSPTRTSDGGSGTLKYQQFGAFRFPENRRMVTPVVTNHTFLTDDEINRIKQYAPQAIAEVPELVVMRPDGDSSDQTPLAFMGVADGRLEMLFVNPDHREHGVGKQLLEHGIAHHNVSELTVNEQNPQAIGFYQHMGFVTYRRTEQDEEGGPYPLLYMRLHQ